MSMQNKGLPSGPFRTAPENGAKLAEFANTLIPGGRGFVQQLFRAKKEVLQGISHLVEAQIDELEHIDSTIQDWARQPPAPPTQGAASRPSTRVMSMGEIMQKAADMFLAKKPKSAARQAIPAANKPSEMRAPPASAGSSGNSPGPATEAPEKIAIS